MKSKDNKLKRFLKKYWFIIILATLAIFSVVFTTCGLWEECKHKSTSVFESIKLLFLHHEFGKDESIPCTLEIGRWLALVFFLWLSGGAIIKFAIPTWLDKKIIEYRFKKHIVIFGEEEIYVKLIDKIRKDNDNTQIVLIVDTETKAKDLKKYTNSKLKVIEGNPLEKNEKKPEENILKIANIVKTSKFFVVTDDDNKNVEIARNIWEYLKEHPKTKKKIDKKKELLESGKKIDVKTLNEEDENVLRCYTLVKDNNYKNILEETPIFKYKRKDNEVFYFEGVVFNLNSVGIQYGINVEIENILPKQSVPCVLIVGFNEAAMSIMLNLSHILTKNRKKITFHIIETDENVENQFNEKYAYLKDFAEFNFNITEEEILKSNYVSIFVCNENNNKAVNDSVSIRYKLQKNDPAIFIVTSNSDYLNSVFNPENTENINDILTFENHNIEIFNRLEYFWELIIEKRDKIENRAKEIHKEYTSANPIDRYEYLTETYKQSNRNAALDYEIKSYLVDNEITEDNIEYLAEIEHRRWMLEKYADGWSKGETRNNTYKINPLLKHWDELKDSEKANDRNSIKLMQRIISETK